MIQKLAATKTDRFDAWRYPCIAALGDAVREIVGPSRPRNLFLVVELGWKMRLAATPDGLSGIKSRVSAAKESGAICETGLEILRSEYADAKLRIESNGTAVD